MAFFLAFSLRMEQHRTLSILLVSFLFLYRLRLQILSMIEFDCTVFYLKTLFLVSKIILHEIVSFELKLALQSLNGIFPVWETFSPNLFYQITSFPNNLYFALHLKRQEHFLQIRSKINFKTLVHLKIY